MKKKIIISLFAVALVLAGCATYQGKIIESRNALKQGQLPLALEKLKKLSEEESKDQLVYLFDYATALQMNNQFEESNKVFLKADKLAEQLDFHSASQIAMATLGSEEMIHYKGDYFEKTLINSFLALNYLMLNKPEDALVEVRRVTEKINKIRLDGRKDFEMNPFAHYLAGIIWESDGKFDDAFISYAEAQKLGSQSPFLKEDLLRVAKKSKRTDEYKKLKEENAGLEEKKDWYNKGFGEVVVLVQQGWGPEKHFSPVDHRYPRLYPVYSHTQAAQIHIDENLKLESKIVYDVENVAIKTLDADVGWMIARKVGAVIAKEVAADQVRQKDKALGDVMWLVMRLSDRADLRQWSTLPRSFQMVRVWLPVGEHTISIQGVDGAGIPTADRLEPVKINISSGKQSFISWRSLR